MVTMWWKVKELGAKRMEVKVACGDGAGDKSGLWRWGGR